MPDMLSNTSCLIALDNIGQLDLLHRLYDIIHISGEVAAEFGVLLPDWVKVHSVLDKTKLNILRSAEGFATLPLTLYAKLRHPIWHKTLRMGLQIPSGF